MKKLILAFTMYASILNAQLVKLYPNEAPGLKKGVSAKEKDLQKVKGDIQLLRDVTEPSLEVFVPKKKTTDAAVIICPGGGYQILAYDHEGTTIAKWYNEKGMTAFVLKYRLPQTELFDNAEIRPLQDAQQAMVHVRKNAAKYGINGDRLGIMGFSAGGHLAATLSNNFTEQVGELKNIDTSVKPNFSVLIYPVISFTDGFGHIGSRDNLLGINAPLDKIDFYSNEKRVTKDTPPTFLIHAFDDVVHIDNSLNYYKALVKHKVPAEMHLYDAGGHGFGLKKVNKGPVKDWHIRLEEWLRFNKWMK